MNTSKISPLFFIYIVLISSAITINGCHHCSKHPRHKPKAKSPKGPIIHLPPIIKPPIHIPPLIPPVIKPPISVPPIVKVPPVTAPPPPKSPTQATCPVDTLKLSACVDVLGGLVHIGLGDPAVNECCPVIRGLAEIEAVVCLCTTLKLKALNLKVYVPLALQLLITCGKTPPPGYTCSL